MNGICWHDESPGYILGWKNLLGACAIYAREGLNWWVRRTITMQQPDQIIYWRTVFGDWHPAEKDIWGGAYWEEPFLMAALSQSSHSKCPAQLEVRLCIEAAHCSDGCILWFACRLLVTDALAAFLLVALKLLHLWLHWLCDWSESFDDTDKLTSIHTDVSYWVITSVQSETCECTMLYPGL